ncbi:unnamed protein product [Aspergillus oryzae]|uniref:Unnamed protein product n=2 Tax=Aspergillus oryzae TaxID=5062 RepID=A0AAN4YGM8_ASPOZ|nr:unnamed protein product [Aspergillus oryzae]GMF84317.1 unnamed protein product [Aspergillus oryzae]GMG05517.1 unnamed protein product [Aspergillus oryzae]GMG26959.1 unnamed protein product [Aspergillus oryzae]GMG44212.1 unnamed protein product [Aspergillus oryzae var. brunneus]
MAETTKVTVSIRLGLIQSPKIGIFPDDSHPFTSRGNGCLDDTLTVTPIAFIDTRDECARSWEDTVESYALA